VTAAVTPVSYPFEPVIAASKQLLYGVRPDGDRSFCGFSFPVDLEAFLCYTFFRSWRSDADSDTGAISR